VGKGEEEMSEDDKVAREEAEEKTEQKPSVSWG
jgi:hypothetical protein